MDLQLPVTDPVLIVAITMGILLLGPLLFERFRIPGLVGLIALGAVAGPSVTGLLERDATFQLLGTFGLLYLMFVAGVTLATVFGGTTSVTETAAVRNFTVAAAHFEALIGTLVTHARVPGRTDGRMACAAVLPIHLRHVETLMVEVMRWANATCFTPMFVGVPMRGVAWRRDDGDVACAMNVRLTSFSYEQSVVLEAFPGWGLDPVPVQRPHRVDIAYEDGRGETREDSVHGHAAHCVQSAVRLWGGATVHD
ncbi:MAG TPA: hypothetical protein EYQ24_02460 [Bacteroidetes bacterium]|nr:hypothetical protein [Bacteroidota bacterium]